MKLADICEVYSGYALKDFNNDLIGLPVIKIGNILYDGFLNLEECQYTTESVNEKYLSQKGDIFIALSGATTGKIGIMHSDAHYVINQRVGIVRRKDSTVPEKYIKYFLIKNTQRILQDAAGCAQPNISPKQIAQYKIPDRNTVIMDRVSETLDIVSDIIAKRKQELQTLDDLIKARFVEMFGDIDLALQKSDWVKISTIGTVVGGSTPKTSVDEYWNGEYRWISPAELKEDSGVIYDSVKKITKAGIESCSLQELPIGTVILSSRAPIGKVAIAGNTFYCNQGFKNIICNESILPRYLYTLLLFNTEYLNSLGRGATFKEISKSIVENIRIPLPSIEKQEQFIEFVEQVDKSKVAVQKALDEAQLLFDSLMQEYFG